MDDAKRDLVRGWLLRALHDLASARKLAAGADPLLDTAIYHCQQSPLSDPDRLTEYGTAFRYPGDAIEPERAEYDRALADADGVYRLALRLLPSAVHPV